MFDCGSAVVYSLDVRGGRPVKVVVDLDVLGVSDVSQVKVYKYGLTREAYVEVEDHVVDVKSRTAAFALKPGDPVVAITSKPIKPVGGAVARGSRTRLYIAIAVIGLVLIASITVLRMRRRM